MSSEKGQITEDKIDQRREWDHYENNDECRRFRHVEQDYFPEDLK